MGGNPEIGEELRQFFLWLLSSGETLTQYYDPSQREAIIDGRDFANEDPDEVRRLLKDGTLREIEEHILAVQGSQARPLVIVWPPM